MSLSNFMFSIQKSGNAIQTGNSYLRYFAIFLSPSSIFPFSTVVDSSHSICCSFFRDEQKGTRTHRNVCVCSLQHFIMHICNVLIAANIHLHNLQFQIGQLLTPLSLSQPYRCYCRYRTIFSFESDDKVNIITQVVRLVYLICAF